jgi:tight adherence protein C
MMLQVMVPILAAMSVFLIGGALMLAQRSRRDRIAARLAIDGGVASAQLGDSPILQGLNTLGKLTTAGKTSTGLREDLARAGFYGPNAAAIFIGVKAGLFLVALLAVAVLASALDLTFQRSLVLFIAAIAAAFFLPNFALGIRRRRRRAEISGHLPDAIDLLEISVTAGMGMDQAWNAVTDQVRAVCSILADEMALTNLEIHLGASRPDAMRHMAERTGATDLNSLVGCLVQAERFGTSLRQALRNFANSMREHRSQRAQEAAEKMAIKLLFPMILFVFPPAVMIMAGPAFLSLARALSGAAS